MLIRIMLARGLELFQTAFCKFRRGLGSLKLFLIILIIKTLVAQDIIL